MFSCVLRAVCYGRAWFVQDVHMVVWVQCMAGVRGKACIGLRWGSGMAAQDTSAYLHLHMTHPEQGCREGVLQGACLRGEVRLNLQHPGFG